MLIKLLKKLLQFTFAVLLISIILGLILPQSYSVDKTIQINSSQNTIRVLVGDFKQWHKWSPWQQISPSTTFIISEPSAGVGAYQSWESMWGFGEMTITAMSGSEITFNVLLNEENIIKGTLSFVNNSKALTVTCQIKGQATNALFSGYVAFITQYILNNAVTLGLNNLKATAQLNDKQITAENYGNKNSTSAH
ncbi:hypothetical protein [Pseudoalteromonas aliena]|uniref:hypothetical protein n=1 Tax=Pseudoalteromonas aliena TaxID=247523 RepID=UPI003CC9C006